MPSAAEKRRAFRELHKGGCFVIPNPSSVGEARYLQHLGFKAVATTSAGAAFSLGLPDNGVPRDAMLAHIRDIAAAADVPVNADFGNGFADDPQSLAENVRACVATGVAGLSIEDATGDPATPLYDFDLAVKRIRAARKAIDQAAADVILVARSECFLTGHKEPLKEAIRRLQQFAEVGADVLYAPGARRRDEIEAIVQAVAPKPVNVLVGAPIGLNVPDLAELGVRRVSVGGALARAAWGGFMRSAREIFEKGSFTTLAAAPTFAELNDFFAKDQRGRLQDDDGIDPDA
jgi:2-methylisocitrate lyase-like PEP mutase family enzyme